MRIEYTIEISKEEIAEFMASLTTMITVLIREMEQPHSCDPSFKPPENPNRDIEE